MQRKKIREKREKDRQFQLLKGISRDSERKKENKKEKKRERKRLSKITERERETNRRRERVKRKRDISSIFNLEYPQLRGQ